MSLQRLNPKFVVERRERNRTHKTSHILHGKDLIFRIVEKDCGITSAEVTHILSLRLLGSKYFCCLEV